MQTIKVQDQPRQTNQYEAELPVTDIKVIANPPRNRLIYIAGPRVFKWKRLVQELDCKYSVDLIERDFEFLQAESNSPNSFRESDADLIVDERTCIM